MSKRRPCDAGGSVRAAKRYCLSQAAKLGVIESVSLQNFMCHDNLKFEFEPHVNFIIGPNGSGKSAVATGIILALGGRSSVTGRYTNIKGFVKEGKKQAVVSVTLKNCGDLSYEPEKYGNKVIIERHFTTNNSSSYKIKSETG
ncbi:Structural maintenance of chromosomes protein 6, partial [Stegodyphus mimosarum]